MLDRIGVHRVGPHGEHAFPGVPHGPSGGRRAAGAHQPMFPCFHGNAIAKECQLASDRGMNDTTAYRWEVLSPKWAHFERAVACGHLDFSPRHPRTAVRVKTIWARARICPSPSI